ncbi:MAG: sigma-70 family RNA polymerase sigma factor [Acidimicrobiia bacterium]|jgi:RNA polymerase sigma-70 factor (ECF subfamily)|nr:sigma-70 family RNA polymerase sigma factor [Acidimicrobiia bacterium]
MGLLRRSPDPATLADEELIALVAGGDERAFACLYDRHARVAWALAHRLLGERTAAEDLVQEAFLALWRGAAGYRPSRGGVRTWLLAILRNRGIDRLRTQGAQARRQGLLEQEEQVLRPAGAPAEEAALGAVQGQAVRRALAQLPDDQREVLRLAYYGGFTHHEIADLLGVPLGTVKSRMRLGLERVRRAIAGPEGVLT